jgi:uncharacterized protein
MKWFAALIFVVCIAIFILQIAFPWITDQFSLTSSMITTRPWTILTYIFLHGGFEHIFYNMFALAIFGFVLENVIGGKKFLTVFFASGIAAGIGSLLFYDSSIGASGAIYGVMGALAILRPKMTVFVGYGIPLPMIVAVILWSAGDLFGFFAPLGNTAYAAHLFGLAFGLAYGLYIRKEYKEGARPRTERIVGDKEFSDWERRYMSI